MLKTAFVAALAGASMVTAAHAADIVLRWGDVVGGSHPQVLMIDRVAAAVAEASGGRIEVQSFPGGQLGGSREMIEATAIGSQQLVTEGAANFGQWVPYISVVEAPYLWNSPEYLISVLNGDMLGEINDLLVPQQGMRVLAALYYGTRHLTTSHTEVHSVDDVAGLKIRVPGNDVFRAMAESWGAQPTPMDFGELYLALQQNVVDGQENPLPTIKAGRFNEVQDYIILTGHIMTPRLVVVNEAFWQDLSEEDRAIIQTAIDEAGDWANQEIMAQEQSLIDEFKAEGVTIIEPDVDSFRQRTLATVPAMFTDVWGEGTFAKLQAAQ